MSGVDKAIGIVLAAIGAALLALGMSLQRYSLITKPPVPFLSYELPQLWVWLAGLLIYFAANGIYALSLLFAPLSLLAGIFTTLLIWNLYFGKRFLNEKLTIQKYQGAFVVMFGVVLTVSSCSPKVPSQLSNDDVEKLFTNLRGSLYIVFLILAILICVMIIFIFEKKYPLETSFPELQEAEGDDLKNKMSEEGTIANQGPGKHVPPQKKPCSRHSTLLVPSGAPPTRHDSTFKNLALIRSFTTSIDLKNTAPIADYIRRFSSFYVKDVEVQKNEKVPNWIDSCMLIIYPGSLGLDEGVAHLSMKAFMSMLAQCGTAGTCGQAILWLMILLWLVSSLATLWWMRTVFKRYETTKALPIEYGAVMAINGLSGLLFYNESQYMETWQIAIMLIGVLVILIGITIGLGKKESPNEDKAQPKQDVEVVNPDNEKNYENEHEYQDLYDDEVLISSINLRNEDSPTLLHRRPRGSTQESLRDITVQLGVDFADMRGEVL